jgi:hypothetical protein
MGHIEFTSKGATKMTTAKQLADFDRHYDAAVIAVFEAWGITLVDWQAAALKRLGAEG